jgi:Zn-dependent alcohol dehydrogenase
MLKGGNSRRLRLKLAPEEENSCQSRRAQRGDEARAHGRGVRSRAPHFAARPGAAGETIAILGAGKLGLAVLDVLCHSAGAAMTLIADLQPFRLDVARKLGADFTINIAEQDPVERVLEVTRGVGVDCVIE